MKDLTNNLSLVDICLLKFLGDTKCVFIMSRPLSFSLIIGNIIDGTYFVAIEI